MAHVVVSATGIEVAMVKDDEIPAARKTGIQGEKYPLRLLHL